MQESKRLFLRAGLVLGAGLLPGCATSSMYEDKYYYEPVKSILVSQDGTKLVVLGPDYHYIFATPNGLVEVLKSSIKDKIQASFNGFVIEHDGSIHGSVTLSLKRDHSPEVGQAAEALGFDAKRHDVTYKLAGDRYRAKEQLAISTSYQLNKEYSVYIRDKGSYAKQALKIAATPITVAADGVVVLGVIILSPIWIPMIKNNIMR